MEPRKTNSTAKSKKDARTGKIRWKNRRTVAWMLSFLAILAAFVLGFALRSNTGLMVSLGVIDPENNANSISSSPSSTTYDSLSARINEAEEMLSSNSFDDVNLDEATNGMLKDLVDSTGDPYAEYFTPERYDKHLQENADKNYSGIGVLFGEYGGRAYVTDVLEGSQAQAEGVEQGDFVVSINGESGHTWSAAEVIGALSNEKGKEAVVTWMRPLSLDASTGHEFTTTLKCNDYDVKNVTYRMKKKIGYIRLKQITGNSAELVKDAVQKLSDKGALAFVLNICDNSGGYLTQSLDIASLFVPSGVLVNIETVDGVSARTASGSAVTTAPLVVMVNGYTSGSAEVLAAALKDNSRATIVGQRTTGKGSVQVTRELSFGGALRYTAAYYLAPNGQAINEVGITPDIEVTGRKDGNDIPLSVALDCANSLLDK